VVATVEKEKKVARLTGPPAHRDRAAQVAAGGCHGNRVLASGREDVEGALPSLPGQGPLGEQRRGLHLPEDQVEAIPLARRTAPQHTEGGLVTVANH